MRRRRVFSSAVAVAVVVLAGCGSSEPEATDVSSTTVAEPESSTTTTSATSTTPPPTTAAPTTTAPPTTLSPKEEAEAEIAERLFDYNEAYEECVADPEACDGNDVVEEFTSPTDDFERLAFLDAWQSKLQSGLVEIYLESKVSVGWVRVEESGGTGSSFSCETSSILVAPRSILAATSTTTPESVIPEYYVWLHNWEQDESGRWLINGGRSAGALAPDEIPSDEVPGVTNEEISACFEQS